MNRVVARRKSASERERTIMKAIVEQTIKKGGNATLASIARRIGLTPSTYLLNVLKSMSTEGKIRHHVATDTRGRKVFHWNVVKSDYQLCNINWLCEGTCYDRQSFALCLGSRKTK